jgi:hypothetical protein
MNKHPQGYSKKLKSSCDDVMFASGEIIISWREKDQDKSENLRTCHLDLDLQYRNTAVLRYEEVLELVENLKIVAERLKP